MSKIKCGRMSLRVGQLFQSAEVFRQMICQFAIANHFNYRFERNSKQRIVVRCRKCKVEDPAGVRNMVKLDIQDGHAVIPVPILIPITKGMLWRWRIYWMVLGYLEEDLHDVQLHLPFKRRVITLMMSSRFPSRGVVMWLC